MDRIECVFSLSDAERYPIAAGLQALSPAEFERHGAEAHLRLLREDIVVARCSLWWTNTPPLSDHAVGIVGHYGAIDVGAATALLDCASKELAAYGCTIAIGPMDGSTWRRYRVLTDRGTEPPFFMEPDNPPDWPAQFDAAGYTVFARYFSALCTDLNYADPRLDRVTPRLKRAGVRLRPIDPARFEEELSAIHALSLISFRDNPLYTPISWPEFIDQYRPILPLIRPDLVLLAEQGDRLAGFLFAVPDVLQAKRGLPVDTIILKSVAVLPGREYAGLGNLLAARCQAAAHALGYHRVIHALMHESNESRSLSAHYAEPFRGYALYSRRLT